MENQIYIIQKKRKSSNKPEQYVVLPMSRKQLENKSEKETQRAFLLDNVWFPKSLVNYEQDMLSMPLWWVTATRKNITEIGEDVSKVLSPLTLTQLRNIVTNTE